MDEGVEDEEEQQGERDFVFLCAELTKLVISQSTKLNIEWLVLSCLVVGSEILARCTDEEHREHLSKKLVKDFPKIMDVAMRNWNGGADDLIEVHRIH